MAGTYSRLKYKTADSCPINGKASFRSTAAARMFVETREEWYAEHARVYKCRCGWVHITSQRTNWEEARVDLSVSSAGTAQV